MVQGIGFIIKDRSESKEKQLFSYVSLKIKICLKNYTKRNEQKHYLGIFDIIMMMTIYYH